MPTAGEQSGNRQRREKGPPILTAEKGEHERAPRAGESCPTPLRATLRAPPSKWVIKGFFPAGERSEPRSRTARRAPADRSPRRAAGWAASGVAVPLAFFGTFFRTERKYYPPLGAAAPPSAPESARQALGRGSRMAKLAFLVACRGLSARHLSPSVRPLKMESALWNDNPQPAPESARRSPGGIFLRPRALLVTKSVRPFPP